MPCLGLGLPRRRPKQCRENGGEVKALEQLLPQFEGNGRTADLAFGRV
jgi:hypothetical protein